MTPRHFVLLLLICVIWGINFVAAKIGVGYLPPLLFTGLRFLILSVILTPYLRFAEGRMAQVLQIAVFNGALHFGLLFLGVALTKASVIAIVVQLNAPFATILSILLLGEIVHWRRWLGIGLTFAGVMVVSFDPHVFDEMLGIVFGAVAALSAAFATILMRRLKDVGVFQLQAWTAAVSAPVLLSASMLAEANHFDLIAMMAWPGWIALLFTSLGASLFAHSAYFYLLQRYEVTLIAPLSLIAPIIGVVSGVLFLNDPLSMRIVAGAALAFVGVAILAIRSKRLVQSGT